MTIRLFVTGAAFVAIASPALAHPGHDSQANGFVNGALHPLLGLDHVVAMLAIGLWAAALGGKAIWKIPAVFVATMIGGFMLATAGYALPGVEPGIAASVLVFGLLIAAAARLPFTASLALAAVFAIFHGQAHGAEASGNAVVFGLGFVATTVLLHIAGLSLGAWISQRRPILARGVGVAVAGVGLLIVGGLA